MTSTLTEAVGLRSPEVRTYQGAPMAAPEAAPADGYTRLEGRAVPYGVRTDTGYYLEEVTPGAFDKSIKEMGSLPLLLWHDQHAFPVGVSESWESRPDGLYGSWRFDSADLAQEAARQAAAGLLVGLSIGFVPIRTDWEVMTAGESGNGERMDVAVRREARLVETSLTPAPAFAGAQVTLVRSRDMPDAVRAHRRTLRARSDELAAWRDWLTRV